MKKIMFSHKWGLHQAVIDGTKTTTLRIIPEKTIKACKDPANPFDYPDPAKLIAAAPYKVGDLVAVAEAYQDVFSPLDWVNRELYRSEPGWKNKMYVSADFMRYFVLITGVSAREIQSLTEEELLADGLHAFRDAALQTRPTLAKEFRNGRLVPEFFFQTMHLDIQKDNALVYRYNFELCKRGTCRVCGCTENHACTNPTHGNCWWVDDTETLCSHCALPEIADDPLPFHPTHSRP